MKHFIYASLFLVSIMAHAQQSYWQKKGSENAKNLKNSATAYQLNLNQFKEALRAGNQSGRSNSQSWVVEMPNAEGEFTKYRVSEFSNFSEELSAKFPGIKSYRGKALNKSGKTISLSLSNDHIQGLVLSSSKEAFIIEQSDENAETYLFYSKNEIKTSEKLKCLNSMDEVTAQDPVTTQETDDSTLRTFRLAVSTDGEFSSYHGGSVSSSLAAVNDLLSFINPVYETDLAIHLELVDNADNIIYTDPNDDPYSITGPAASPQSFQQLSGQLQTVMTDSIGEANYDMGVLFSDQIKGGFSGCIACVCVDGSKGGAVAGPTGNAPEGFAYAMTLAHEMGHQFGANHTFSRSENTGANQEPGSGNTVMGYAGATQFWDVKPVSDGFFHHYSIEQISNYVTTTSCATEESLNNAAPTANAGNDYNIPNGTAFKLTADASDADGDNLTYSWEQADATTNYGQIYHYPSPSSTTVPNYRTFEPTQDSVRSFPKFKNVLNGNLFKLWEMTPTIGRNLHFTVEVRDNNPVGGQTASDDMEVNVSLNAGPFKITSIDEYDGFELGATHELTWDVSGTDQGPINTSKVNILLSTDGGDTFESLAENTDNDGEEEITMPSMDVDEAYIMIEAVDNIFYAVTPVFSIGSKISQDCDTYSSNGPVDIGSGNSQPTPISVNVPDQGTVEDLNVTFELENTDINNLIILMATGPSTQGFLYYPDADCSSQDGGSDYTVSFSPEANSPYAYCGDLDGKTVQGTNNYIMEDLIGESRSGNYVFAVIRAEGAPTGTVNSVEMSFCNDEQVSLGLEDQEESKDLTVYPNPSDGLVNISSKGYSGETDLNVYSITGKKVFEKQYENMSAKTNLDLSNLSAGVYLMKIKNDQETSVRKIVIK